MRMVLFFTRGMSLKAWDDTGMFEREVALYRQLQERGVEVIFVTYGGESDQPYRDRLNGIGLIALSRSASPRRALAGLLIRYWPTLLGSAVLKTNQIAGSELAVWCKRLFGKKLIVRCGYLPSVFARQQTQNTASIDASLALERRSFRAADAAVVSSECDREYLLESQRVMADKVNVIPNYVMTEVFRPMPEVEKKYDLVCVARASPQKNIDGMLEALLLLRDRGRDIKLLLLGGSSTNPEVKAAVQARGLNVTLGSNVPHFELPLYLNSARAFVLPSHYEGHPKVLLEAMSCGLPCIGANVVGIRELIEHGRTGWLCGVDAESISKAVESVLDQPSLRTEVGRNARQHVEERFSLDHIVDMEMALLEKVAA